MNYYSHLQHVQHKQEEAQRHHRERRQRDIITQKKQSKRQLSLWRIIWAWWIARRDAEDYDEMLQMFISLLQPRKTKAIHD